MSFLNPIMLFGVAAVAVPILIHLLNRKKFQRIAWGAMRFIKASLEQNRRRLRIEDLILLCLRCLLLFLLALALARPAIQSSRTGLFGQSRVSAVLLLDNSLSMATTDGTESRFEKARRAAEGTIDSLPTGSEVAVLLISDRIDSIIPEPTYDLNLARKAVREARLTDHGSEFSSAIRRAIQILEPRKSIRREIFLISDDQAIGWQNLEEIRRSFQQSLDPVRGHFILIQDGEYNNLALTELRLASEFSTVNRPLRFEARVENFGEIEQRNVRVKLLFNNQPPSDEVVIPVLPPGSSQSIALFGKLSEEGFHGISANLPGDRLAPDDKRSVVINAVKEVKILLVDGDPGSEAREAETFFLRHALQPVRAESTDQYFLRSSVVSAADLSATRLDSFDVVVLANVPQVNESLARSFQSFLQGGGGLVVFPGDKINPQRYNEILGAAGLLPARLGKLRGTTGNETQFLTLQNKPFEHPIVSIWNDPAAGTLNSARFFRSYELAPLPGKTTTNGTDSHLSPGPPAGEPRVIVSYNDGSPAVMEKSFGLGRVVLFSSSANTEWNDFPVRPAFVPLLHRMVGQIIQNQDAGLNIQVGEKFKWQFAPEVLGRELVFYKKGQPETSRAARRIERIQQVPAVEYDQTHSGGIYEVSMGDPKQNLKFAVQPNPSESNLKPLTSTQVQALGNMGRVHFWKPRFSLKSELEKERIGSEIWWPILIGAMLVAVLETFLAQWFSKSK